MENKLEVLSGELIQSRLVRDSMLHGNYNFTRFLYEKKYWVPSSVIEKNESHGHVSKSKVNGFATSPIAYCKDCISDSIFEFGYGYFKRVWWRSSWCRVHQKKLRVLTSIGRWLSQDILAVLSGFEAKSSSQISYEHYYHRISKKPFQLNLLAPYGELYIDVDYDFGIPQNIKYAGLFEFTPCFQVEFLFWYLTKHDELTRQLSYRADLQAFIFLFRAKPSTVLNVDLSSLIDYVFLFFNLFCQESNQFFKEFVESNAYLANDNILKCSKYNCSMCPNIEWSKACGESQDICRVRLFEPVLRFFGSGLVRVGKEYFRAAEDNSVMLSKSTQIDKIHYINNGDYVCDFKDRERRTVYSELYDLYEKYTLLGWRDKNYNSSAVNPSVVDYPLYNEAQVMVIPHQSNVTFWPEIQFDTFVSWEVFVELEHRFKVEIEKIMGN